MEIVDSPSGGVYPDQRELTWEEVSEMAGEYIVPELTSLTQLRRRIFSFSKRAMHEFCIMNCPSAPSRIHLSLMFTNYIGAHKSETKLVDFLQSSGINYLRYPDDRLLLSHGPDTSDIKEFAG
jgi:hypothetical protein